MQDKAIKGLRLELALSQERFARLLGVSLQTVRRWEAGLSRPLPFISLKLEELQRIAASLGCALSSPFATLSFLPLAVIPELRLTDKGLVDVIAFKLLG